MAKWRVAHLVGAAVSIVVAVAAITVLVYFTGVHGIAVHFYYLPIIYAAFVFGDWGAALTSLLVAMLAGPWMPARYGPEGPVPQELWEGIPRLLMFFVVAMVSSRTSYALKRRVTEARTLYDVAGSISSSLRINRVLNLIATSAVEVMGAQACAIRLLNKETGDLRLAATSGLDEAYWGKGPVSLDSSPLDASVVLGEIVQVRDAASDPRFQYGEAARQAGIVSVLSMPLQSKDETLGVVRIYSRRRRLFRPAEVDLLSAFAHQAAVAIENAQLYEDIRRNYFETVRALTRAIEAKDSATYNHSERVTELSQRLSQAMCLSDEELEQIEFGCVLHDIGKIGLDEQAIDARGAHDPGSLFYRMHPLIGRTIIQPIGFLQPTLDIIVHHHERWDGTGYPEGLKGEAIPFHARLVAVCDGYDRLLHPSGVDSGLSPREALEAIIDAAGSEYDPRLVAEFRKMMTADRSGQDEAGPA